VAARGIGILLGLQATLNPFSRCPSYKEIADLPLAERVAALREPSRRAAMLAECADRPVLRTGLDNLYPLDDPPDYEPAPEARVTARAEREGRDAADLVYDLLLEREGTALLYSPSLNYPGGNLDAARELLTHPLSVPGLSDGGAHVGTICDASFPTTLLTHWCRDRQRGERLDVPFVVQRQCRDTARTVGLHDRGVLAPGYRADINVIDLPSLKLCAPELAFDLPAGGKRFLQRAEGYRHTFVAGEETYADGEATGALPGRLVRGARSAPTGGTR
jgi:N-acyl-D-aspartate/D-glutamate deacylase